MIFLLFSFCFVSGLFVFCLPLTCQHPFKELQTFSTANYTFTVEMCLIVNHSTVVHRTLARLQPTWWRLGAVAGDTNGQAGYERPSSHETFCGVTPAIVPNRLLSAGILPIMIFLFVLQFSLLLRLQFSYLLSGTAVQANLFLL